MVAANIPDIKQAEKRYGFLVDFYEGPNDPLYKQLILELAWHDSYIKRDGTHILLESQRRMAKLFKVERLPSEYADIENKPKPDYEKDKRYDSPLADVVRMYEVLLSLYDLGYKHRQYGQAASTDGLEGRLGGK